MLQTKRKNIFFHFFLISLLLCCSLPVSGGSKEEKVTLESLSAEIRQIVAKLEPKQQTWGEWIWNSASGAGGAIILAITVPRMIDFINGQIDSCWLTEEEKNELLEDRKAQRILARQQTHLNKTEIQLRNDPRWKEIILSAKEQENLFESHKIHENELRLAKASRDEEEEKIKHLKFLISEAPTSEIRSSLEEQLDRYIKQTITKNIV